MNKILVSLVLGCALFTPAQASDRVENMKKLTVLVTNEGFLGGGRGSGILIDSTHVLTCAHMAESAKDEFFIYTYPFGTVTKAHIENINFPADLLMLKLDTPVTVRVKPVFQTVVQDGEPITVVGNALGSMKWYVTVGVISGRERDYLMTDAHVNHGNSGGPWFNAKGEVVALSDWGLTRSGATVEGVTGGVSAKTITETVDGWANMKRLMDALLKALRGTK